MRGDGGSGVRPFNARNPTMSRNTKHRLASLLLLSVIALAASGCGDHVKGTAAPGHMTPTYFPA